MPASDDSAAFDPAEFGWQVVKIHGKRWSAKGHYFVPHPLTPGEQESLCKAWGQPPDRLEPEPLVGRRCMKCERLVEARNA